VENLPVDLGGGHRRNFDYIADAPTPDALARLAASIWIGRGWNGAPGAIRTPDLLVRSQIEPNPANSLQSSTCNGSRMCEPVEPS
jgi:hypothetical protein